MIDMIEYFDQHIAPTLMPLLVEACRQTEQPAAARLLTLLEQDLGAGAAAR